MLRVLALLLLLSSPAAAQQGLFDRRYDDDIKSAVRYYWPEMPNWRLAKAQLYQESRLDCDAISPVGARGCAQFMPATWREVTQRLGMPGKSPHSRYAFKAYGFYMGQERTRWERRGAVDPERHKLALASYNAGAGNIIKASNLCERALEWDIVAVCLPQVTGRHAAETRGYIPATYRWYQRLLDRRYGEE